MPLTLIDNSANYAARAAELNYMRAYSPAWNQLESELLARGITKVEVQEVQTAGTFTEYFAGVFGDTAVIQLSSDALFRVLQPDGTSITNPDGLMIAHGLAHFFNDERAPNYADYRNPAEAMAIDWENAIAAQLNFQPRTLDPASRGYLERADAS